MFKMSEGRVTAIWPEGARLWALGGWGREIRVGDVITEEDEEVQIELATTQTGLTPMAIMLAIE